jgi:hypothetical protein
MPARAQQNQHRHAENSKSTWNGLWICTKPAACRGRRAPVHQRLSAQCMSAAVPREDGTYLVSVFTDFIKRLLSAESARRFRAPRDSPHRRRRPNHCRRRRASPRFLRRGHRAMVPHRRARAGVMIGHARADSPWSPGRVWAAGWTAATVAPPAPPPPPSLDAGRGRTWGRCAAGSGRRGPVRDTGTAWRARREASHSTEGRKNSEKCKGCTCQPSQGSWHRTRWGGCGIQISFLQDQQRHTCQYRQG